MTGTRLTPELEGTLMRYARGALEEPLRTELEELLVTDPDVFEALGVVEDELIEEYLDGDGSAVERRSFEEHFLASPGRMRRLSLARALRARAAAVDGAARVEAHPVAADRARPGGRAASWIEAVAALLTPSRWQPAWVAVVSALAVSLTANVWLASRPGPASVGATTLVLASGLLRADGALPRVAVPAGAAGVRLVLELPGDDYPRYRAALLDDDGIEVWAASRLKAETTDGRTSIALLVPAALLPGGDYQVKLSGITRSGEEEALFSSPFRVTGP